MHGTSVGVGRVRETCARASRGERGGSGAGITRWQRRRVVVACSGGLADRWGAMSTPDARYGGSRCGEATGECLSCRSHSPACGCARPPGGISTRGARHADDTPRRGHKCRKTPASLSGRSRSHPTRAASAASGSVVASVHAFSPHARGERTRARADSLGMPWLTPRARRARRESERSAPPGGQGRANRLG